MQKENLISPLVSVCIFAYNHEKFIEEAIQSVLKQITAFDFEIIIGEDGSQDETLKIIQSFSNSYPSKIRVLIQDQSKKIYIGGKPTGRYNFITTLESCKGEFIALLDGDDYWTDPLKLQKQVDFLEANPEYGICFHKVAQLNMFDREKDCIIPDVTGNTVYTLEDYILNNRTATCSLVFKRELIREIPSWFYKVPFGDLALVLLVMYNSNKKGMVLNDKMGVYRIHENGIHGSFHKNDLELIKAYRQHLVFTKIIQSELLFEEEYRKSFLKKMQHTQALLAKLYKRNNKSLLWLKAYALEEYFKLRANFVK